VVLRTVRIEAIANNGSVERVPGSGRPRTTRTAEIENVDAVGDLVQSQDNQRQIGLHRSTRQISRELGIPQANNWDDFFCSPVL